MHHQPIPAAHLIRIISPNSSILGWPISTWFDGNSHLRVWHQGLWVGHVAAFMLFLVILLAITWSDYVTRDWILQPLPV